MTDTRPLPLLFGGLFIIVAALVLNHVQVQASTEKALTQAEVSRNLVAARDLKVSLERGMGFGKPLSLFSGSDKLFESLKTRYQGIEFLAFTGTNLEVYAQEGAPVLDGLPQQQLPVFPAVNNGKGEGAFSTIVKGNLVLVSLPLYFNNSDLKGLVWLGFSRAPIIERLDVESRFGGTILAALVGAAGLAFVALYFLLVRVRHQQAEPELKRKKFYLPLLTRISAAIVSVLLVSILGYSFATNGRFTNILLQLYAKNVEVLVGSQAADLKRILEWNIEPSRWKGAETLLAAQIRHTPEVQVLALTDEGGKVLYQADRDGTFPNAAGTPANPAVLMTASEDWVRQPIADAAGVTHALLWSRVDQKFLDAILLDRFLDALTVTVVSLIFSIELLLALGLLSRRQARQPGDPPNTEIGIKTVRFTAFLFFLSELLPIPFLPLFIADLYAHAPLEVFQLSADAVKGLPFSAHLLGVMIFVPIVGALTQKWSLKRLFLGSGFLLWAGNFAAAFSGNLEALIFFRFLSGLGYGGALAASAALVVQTTAKEKRTSGFAAWGAGFAAASICAVILGGILASHVGYRNGLLVSAGISILLALFVILYHPGKPPVGEVEVRKNKLSDLFAPFRDRTAFITLLFASIPVQLAFFGLFQYTLPLAMSQSGISEANIGRILTIYGLISLGAPLLARFADRHRNEKLLILAGNILTGLCLMLFFIQNGLLAMVFVVAAIGVGGLMFDTVISSYLSMTKSSEAFGEANFLSIFLTWEKLFTVFIPVLVGTLMTALGYYQSAAVLGVVILVGSIIFWLFSGKKARQP